MGTSILRAIYSLFLAFFLVFFVGLGIEFFYPSEKAPEYPSELNYKTSEVFTQKQKDLQEKYDSDVRSYEASQGDYNRNVSIIAICASIILMTLGLIVVPKMNLFSDGFLTGGLFALIYGIGRGIGSGDNKYRFVVVTVGLLVVMILGYLKFSEKKTSKS